MSTRHIAAESARLHDLTPDGSSGRASKRFRQKLAADGFTVEEGFQLKPGYLYTVVRAISARVNQNYDGWPSDELKKSYKTFIGKPVFVNHENHDPTKARGVVVAARYVENGMDKYVEVVQEIDAGRFPKLAHEIKTGGLDSVSMGAEAGFTICSYCHNKATDLHDMCDHVINHKGKTLSRLDRKTGKKEDVLVFESCHKISFFELSYVFEPADETAVASKVVVAGLDKNAARNDWELQTIRKNKATDINGDSHDLDWGESKGYALGEKSSGLAPKCSCGWQSDSGSEASGRRNFTDHIKSIKKGSRRTANDDVAVPAPPGTPTIPQSVIDSTPVVNLSPATELTGHEAPGLKQSGKYTKEDFNHPSGKKPWERDTESDAEDAAAIEIEAMLLRTAEHDDLPPLPANFNVPDHLGEEKNTSSAEPWTDPEEFIKYHKDYFGGEADPATQSNIRNMSEWDLHSYWKDLEKNRGKSPDQIRDERQQGKAKAKEMAEGLWNAFYPPEEEEGRKSVQNMDTVGKLMDNGWQPEHIKYDEDDQPYAHYQHPSGWSVSDHGGMYKDIGHAATPGESHDVINVSHNVDGQDYHAPFGPADAHAHIENQLNGDPEETGGTLQYLTQNHPAIRKYKPPRTAELNGEDLRGNANLTTALNTHQTYHKAHQIMDEVGAPDGPRLDVGSGKVGVLLADELGHDTYEPYPHDGFEPKYRSFGGRKGVPAGKYGRVTNLNVLNVLPPEERRNAIAQIGGSMAPGGHAVITVRKWKGDVENSAPHPNHLDNQPDPATDPNSVITGGSGGARYQHGYANHQELADELHGVLGDGYSFTPIKGKFSSIGVHVLKTPAAQKARSADLKKIARSRALKLAYGEIEAPMAVDTLREEGTAPEDDDDDFERYVDPPKDLQDPDLDEAQQVDREQEEAGATPDQMGGVPGAADPMAGAAPQAPQQQYMTLQIPIPAGAPQIPQQAAPPVMAEQPPQDPAQEQPPMQMSASTLDYFDRYYGRRVANWLDAIEARREMNPAEAADYRRQLGKLSTLENGREHSTTNRNPGKEPADMARNTLASRSKVARSGRRQHIAEGPLVDGGDRSRNDQGEQEEAFISQTPPEVRADVPTEDTPNISNTEHNLVARVQQGRAQLLRDAQALAAMQQRRTAGESGGPTATVVDPTVQTGPEGEALTGTGFVSADPNDGVVPTNPKDASLRAFQAFDGWLAHKTGKSSRNHTEATIKKAAAAFSREAGISPQMLFPALGIVLREARKNDKTANTKGAKMRKRANESLEVAAPDGRVDVEAPVADTTDAEAQASQFDLHDFGNNAGDNVAKPDLSTDQNWAPGEASKTSAIKTAGGLLAMRCAEGMIAAGLEPNDRERKYQLAAQFENMNRGLIQDRVALLERFAAVREADQRRVASGSSRGAARSPIPAGLGGGTRTAGAGMRVAAHDPSNDSSLFI